MTIKEGESAALWASAFDIEAQLLFVQRDAIPFSSV